MIAEMRDRATHYARSRSRQSTARYLLRLFITGVLMAIALRRVDIGNVLSALTGVDLPRFGLGMLAFAGAQMLYAKRTQILLRSQNMPASVLNVFGMNLTSAFYTLIVPTSLAGGIVRWHRMSTVDGEHAQAFSVLLLERVLDNYCWGILLCVASISLSLRNTFPLWLTMGLSLALGTVTGAGYTALGVIRRRKVGSPLPAVRAQFIPRGISVRMANVLQAISNSVGARRELEKIAGLSLALNLILQITIYNVLLAFVPDMMFDQFLFVNMALTILIQLPITIAGIGLNETFFGQILPAFGMNSLSALTVGVAGSIMNVLWCLIGGGLELFGFGQFRKLAVSGPLEPQAVKALAPINES